MLKAHTLSRKPTEPGGKAFWDSEEFDRHLARCWDARVASESLRPVEAIMGALCTGQGSRRKIWVGRETLLHLHFHALVTQQLQARPPIGSPTPVTPSKRLRTDSQWMQQHADLAWLLGGAALPLALRAQRTGAATADASPIHDAQAPIGFSPLFMREKLLVSGALQCPIRLESEILAADSTSFPGQAHVRGSIARGRGRVWWSG